jgi:hypothetical protein
MQDKKPLIAFRASLRGQSMKRLAWALAFILILASWAGAETVIINRVGKLPLTGEVYQHGNITINPEPGKPEGKPQLGKIERQESSATIILPGKPPILGHSDGKGIITIENPEDLGHGR